MAYIEEIFFSSLYNKKDDEQAYFTDSFRKLFIVISTWSGRPNANTSLLMNLTHMGLCLKMTAFKNILLVFTTGNIASEYKKSNTIRYLCILTSAYSITIHTSTHVV